MFLSTSAYLFFSQHSVADSLLFDMTMKYKSEKDGAHHHRVRSVFLGDPFAGRTLRISDSDVNLFPSFDSIAKSEMRDEFCSGNIRTS